MTVTEPLALPLVITERAPKKHGDHVPSTVRGRCLYKGPTVTYLIFYLGVATLLGIILGRATFMRPDGIYTGFDNNLGDLPFHLQVISSFAHGHNTRIEDPTFAGARFTYPFVADYVSALLVRMGLSLQAAMWLPSMVCAVAFVWLLSKWTEELTGSRRAGAIAVLLVLFSGGLGWWQIFQDVRNSDHGLFPLLMHLPHDYTIVPGAETIYRWGNTLTTLFVPQRSILLGAPIAVFIFRQWWRGIQAGQLPGSLSNGWTSRCFLQAGLCAGLLPLIHTHTFLAVMAVAACELLLFRSFWRGWLAFFAIAIAISMPQVLWLLRSDVHTREFLGWHLGWDHGNYNPLAFWIVNTGTFIPLLLIALLEKMREPEADRRWVRLYLPFALCFIIPNLTKLAPWVWDNIKVLFYWYLASVPLVAALLASWLKDRERRMRWMAAGLLASLLLSGVLDVVRVLSHAEEYREFDNGAIAVSRVISEKVPLSAVVLHAPTYNSPVFLTGRRSLLGHPAWAWSRGLDGSQREQDIKDMFAGKGSAGELLHHYQVGYVLIGPQERNSLQVNDAFWQQYPKVASVSDYELFRIPQN